MFNYLNIINKIYISKEYNLSYQEKLFKEHMKSIAK